MSQAKAYITGIGIISPLGNDVNQTKQSLLAAKCGIKPLSIFKPSIVLPVGEISTIIESDEPIPRTHSLAYQAAQEALTGIIGTMLTPDAIVIGVTTGGMPDTEINLKEKKFIPELYTYHATSTVAEYLAKKTGCNGSIITVSTACSSGAVAIKIGLELIRTGNAKKVLVGGVDSICRLTYYGFNSLQLIDPEGSRPLDKNRKGMSVAEGAGMLLLSRDEEHALAEIYGAGLSCDAYHPAAPHPEGDGARRAMRLALSDAGLGPKDIDYINLHGTGTKDNDAAEAKAIRALFMDSIPPLSSIKGASGHSLAASGAIEAVIATICLNNNFIPANVNCNEPDPEIHIIPLTQPHEMKIDTILSNSFGFGGNNASVVIGTPRKNISSVSGQISTGFFINKAACFSGAGDLKQTLEKLLRGMDCQGTMSQGDIAKDLPPRSVRRLKRLPIMALALSNSVLDTIAMNNTPTSLFFATGWGPLSETYDFMRKLYESNEEFTSPTDFVGSVHNAPAGQIAIKHNITGPNITLNGGDYSFEQALFTANILTSIDETVLLLCADEAHNQLTPLFDKSATIHETLSDGGSAFLLSKKAHGSNVRLAPYFYENNITKDLNRIDRLIESLGGTEHIENTYSALMLGIPASEKETVAEQLNYFLKSVHFKDSVLYYRTYLGEYASASAVACALAFELVKENTFITETKKTISLNNKGILNISFGNCITAIGVTS